jgi:GDP-mannose transporter
MLLQISLTEVMLTTQLQVLSSVIAAWADISDTLAAGDPAVSQGISWSVTGVVRNLNIGYFWMLVNCLASAAYVRSVSCHLV